MAAQQSDSWDSLWEAFDHVRDSLKRSHAERVNSKELRLEAKELVQKYFRAARPSLVQLGAEQAVAPLDELMQELLRLTNGRNSRRGYLDTLAAIGRLRPDLELRREMLMGAATGTPIRTAPTRGSAIETAILQTLDALIPSAAASYHQAARDLGMSERRSYRGSAVELREVLREVLDHLAPDDAVMKSAGFALEKDKTRPTMKQKARFILKSRGSSGGSRSTAEESVTVIEESTASLARSVYERGSLSTHVATTRREVLQLRLYLDAILAELLEIL